MKNLWFITHTHAKTVRPLPTWNWLKPSQESNIFGHSIKAPAVFTHRFATEQFKCDYAHIWKFVTTEMKLTFWIQTMYSFLARSTTSRTIPICMINTTGTCTMLVGYMSIAHVWPRHENTGTYRDVVTVREVRAPLPPWQQDGQELRLGKAVWSPLLHSLSGAVRYLRTQSATQCRASHHSQQPHPPRRAERLAAFQQPLARTLAPLRQCQRSEGCRPALCRAHQAIFVVTRVGG